MRKMQVLSVSLYDYTVREAMRKVEEFLQDGKPSTIAYVSIKGIMEADENEQIKEFYNKLDLIISEDSDILRAANVQTRSRLREIDENVFMDEFLKKLVRQRKTVYLLAQTEAELTLLETGLRSYQENLRVAGRFALDHLEADEDFIVNEINMVQPCVLISILPSMRRIEFYDANHMKLNTNIWLMLKDGMDLQNKKKGLLRKLSDNLWRSIFKKRLLQYRNEKEKGGEEDDSQTDQ
ncbi:MAG: hypothetical protein IJ711_06940 [Lachnospiraceae bacterium]|nr:hypothetical protein [Lachnospiraceae bacterium]